MTVRVSTFGNNDPTIPRPSILLIRFLLLFLSKIIMDSRPGNAGNLFVTVGRQLHCHYKTIDAPSLFNPSSRLLIFSEAAPYSDPRYSTPQLALALG